MIVSRLAVSLAVTTAVVFAITDPARGIPLVTETKLTAASPVEWGRLGTSVAIDGDTAVAGEVGDDDVATDAGAVHVWVRTGDTWSLQEKITAADTPAEESFGWSTDLQNDTLAVGTYPIVPKGPGAVYVFTRTGDTWSQQAKLQAAGTLALGVDLDLDGDTIVAAPVSGYPFVFVRSGSSWSEQAQLSAGGPFAAVAVDGDTVMVGSTYEGGNGRVHVFERSGTAWSEVDVLEGSAVAPGGSFGYDVGLDGDTAVIGAPFDGPGQAYVFVRSGGTWSEQARLDTSQPNPNGGFGIHVGVDGERAVVAAYFENGPGGHPIAAGAVYLFERSGSAWSQRLRLTASDAYTNDVLGWGAAHVQGDRIASAAPFDDDKAAASGSVYLFDLSEVSGGLATKKLKVKNALPDRPDANLVTFVARTPILALPPAGSSGDPRCGAGGAAEITVASTASGHGFTQALPCENWSIMGPELRPKGYRYKDSRLTAGPCKLISLRAPGTVKVQCLGRGPLPLDYDLEPGVAETPVAVTLTTGPEFTYCAEAGGVVSRDGSDGKVFLARGAPAPVSCP